VTLIMQNEYTSLIFLNGLIFFFRKFFNCVSVNEYESQRACPLNYSQFVYRNLKEA